VAASDPIEIPDGAPAERVDELYGLPLDEFTAGRDALAKELRQSGEREQAAWVKGLRKPSAAAWVVNQLARTQAKQAKRLLDTGERLRTAHERLLGGEAGSEDLRRASDEQSDAVRELLANAPGLLDRDGNSPSRATLEKAEQTLHAVPLDERTSAAFAAGRLTEERRAAGLGPFGEGMPAAAPRPKRARATKGGDGKRSQAERAKARKALDEAKGEHRDREKAARKAERALDQARRQLERAQGRVDEATTELDEARAAEADAKRRVAEAEAEVEGKSI
jgi:hypothetical protein